MKISETFENLDEKKQQRILNAALQEFAENGYERASTNKIVKSAGIGKGMLFYYFKNKKALYMYLMEYSFDFIENHYLNQIDTNEVDFIERFKQASQLKMKCYTENPQVFSFLGNLFLDNEPVIPDNYQERYKELQEIGFTTLYENIDKTLFRNEIDVNKAFQLIKWSLEGYQNDLLTRLKGQNLTKVDFDIYWDEFNDYLEILKVIYYDKAEE